MPGFSWRVTEHVLQANEANHIETLWTKKRGQIVLNGSLSYDNPMKGDCSRALRVSRNMWTTAGVPMSGSCDAAG